MLYVYLCDPSRFGIPLAWNQAQQHGSQTNQGYLGAFHVFTVRSAGTVPRRHPGHDDSQRVFGQRQPLSSQPNRIARRNLPMDQISAQPLYHFLASVLAVAPALTFAAMFISSLPSILAKRA